MAGPKGETAQTCRVCGREPASGSGNCYITRREHGFVIWQAVCVDCKIAHYRTNGSGPVTTTDNSGQ